MHASEPLPALSLSAQPQLKDLYEVLGDRSDPTPRALICGAGVTMDAGLPSWSDLVENMCKRIADPTVAEAALKDQTDVIRKVEYISRLIDSESREETIRHALYDGHRPVRPGSLAETIANLVELAPFEIKLATTNYDVLLEKALVARGLAETTRSFVVDEIGSAGDQFDEWLAQVRSDHQGVLHLHGIIEDDAAVVPRGRLLISEVDFLRYGPLVKERLAAILDTHHVIFLGLSLADPNMIAALDLTKTRSTRTFFVAAPDYLKGVRDPAAVRQYLRKRLEYLSGAFVVTTIELNAYAQAAQFVSECGLAITSPRGYLQEKPTSLRYGHRFQRLNRKAHASIKWNSVVSDQPIESRQFIAERLASVLDRRSKVGQLLYRFGEALPAAVLRDNHIAKEFVASEGFALFLWLRTRQRQKTDMPGFRIRLVGSSAYVHLAPWTQDLEIDVEAKSEYPAAESLFYGNVRLTRLSNQRLWQTSLAVPVALREPKSAEFPVWIGAVTLNTQRYLRKDDAEPDTQADPAEAPPSLLGLLEDSQRDELAQLLRAEATALLQP